MNAFDLKAGMEVFTKVVVEEVRINIVRVHTKKDDGDADISFWLYTDEVQPVQPVREDKKALKFSVGDEVIHRDYPALGIGTIERTDCWEKTYKMEINKDRMFYGALQDFPADYAVSWEEPGRDFYTTEWLHAEEFLLPARRKDA